MSSTIEHLSTEVPQRRRWLHRVIQGGLVLLLGLTVLDGLDVVDVVGPDEEVLRVEGEGYVLEVEHPSVTRPALASVFRFTVTREGGFDEPLQVGVKRHYLEAWDVNGTLPAPDGETSVGDWVVWEFPPPPGDELVVTYEARLEPGLQAGRDGAVAVFEEDVPVLTAEFRTAVRP